MGQERRKFPRGRPESGYQIACYPTAFRKEGDSTRSLATKFIDLSSKGACIVTPGRLRPGVILTVHVRHTQDRSRFKGKAVVRWAKTLKRNRKEAHIAGLEFTEILDARGERMMFLRKWARGLGLLTPEERRQNQKKSVLQKARIRIFEPRSFLESIDKRVNGPLGSPSERMLG